MSGEEPDTLGDERRRAGPAEAAGTLVLRLVSHVAELLRLHLLLSGQELRQLARELLISAVFIVVAAFMSVFAVGLLLTSAVLALSLVLTPWAAALVVLGASTVLIAALGVVGAWRVRTRARRFAAVMDALRGDLRWLWSELLRIG
ncbi:MAG TPA: phage holin family protein [bacterium]|nr:phage holin family protein [bacterium]